jgi:hypothetical protein
MSSQDRKLERLGQLVELAQSIQGPSEQLAQRDHEARTQAALQLLGIQQSQANAEQLAAYRQQELEQQGSQGNTMAGLRQQEIASQQQIAQQQNAFHQQELAQGQNQFAVTNQLAQQHEANRQGEFWGGTLPAEYNQQATAQAALQKKLLADYVQSQMANPSISQDQITPFAAQLGPEFAKGIEGAGHARTQAAVRQISPSIQAMLGTEHNPEKLHQAMGMLQQTNPDGFNNFDWQRANAAMAGTNPAPQPIVAPYVKLTDAEIAAKRQTKEDQQMNDLYNKAQTMQNAWNWTADHFFR